MHQKFKNHWSNVKTKERCSVKCIQDGFPLQDDQLSPSVFADIIYENYLFDIPMLMDISVLFGKTNGPLLTKMITNIFNTQPKYQDDLRSSLVSVIQARPIPDSREFLYQQ